LVAVDVDIPGDVVAVPGVFVAIPGVVVAVPGSVEVTPGDVVATPGTVVVDGAMVVGTVTVDVLVPGTLVLAQAPKLNANATINNTAYTLFIS
jgi:hypothetical protein